MIIRTPIDGRWIDDAGSDRCEVDGDEVDGGEIDGGEIDGYDVLDQRTRERAVTADMARPGRYLAVSRAGRQLLIPLDRPITQIGRGLVSDIRLDEPRVSRRHAIVAIRGDGPDAVRVLDDRSSAGTFVNGRAVTVSQLRDGDVVVVGRVALRFVEIADSWRRRGPRRIAVSGRRR